MSALVSTLVVILVLTVNIDIAGGVVGLDSASGGVVVVGLQ